MATTIKPQLKKLADEVARMSDSEKRALRGLLDEQLSGRRLNGAESLSLQPGWAKDLIGTPSDQNLTSRSMTSRIIASESTG